MNGDVDSTGTNGVLMVANDAFDNIGANAINVAEASKWLIYSVNPSLNTDGGLTGSSQMATTWPALPAFAGNGFLYSYVPVNPNPLTPPQMVTYQTSGTLVKWDVPTPGAATHGGGFFGIIDTPQYTTIYRDEHPDQSNPDYTPGGDDQGSGNGNNKTYRYR
jgi:hypothetical protein